MECANLSSPRPSFRSHDLPGVELDQHRGVRLQVFHWYGESKVVKKEELQFEVVEFDKWEAADLQEGSVRDAQGKRRGEGSGI